MPNDPIRNALAELVRLKDIKDRAEALHFAGPLSDAGENWESEYDRLRADYIQNQPLAWDAARAALRAQPAAASVPDDEREAFEAAVKTWAAEQWVVMSVARSHLGIYVDHATRAAWSAWQARTALAAPAAPMKTPDVGSWREEFSKRIYANLAAADNQDVPLEEYPGRILAVMDGMGVAPYKVAIAYETLKAAMREDQSYAWSWHCNLAMPIMDAIHCSQQQANEAAARLMRHLFDIDVTSFREWEPFAAPAAPKLPDDHYEPPFENCSFRLCDLPGQCRSEGKCHHPAMVSAPQEQPSDEDDLTQALKERDDAEDMADQLAAQIAAITGEEIGEHSSANDPWRNAMLAADEFIAVQIRKLCSAPARQTAPQEQPSDEEIRDIWSQQEGFHPDPVAFAHALLSRYGAAPQAGEDAQPFAWAIDYKDGRRVFTDDEAFVTSGINQSIREQRGDKVTRLFATPQPAPRAAPAVLSDPTEKFMADVIAELRRARAKFPGDRIMTIALAEEFGELCKAMLDEPGENVWKEAVQTAVMAARVAVDGDSSVDEWRASKGLDNHRALTTQGADHA